MPLMGTLAANAINSFVNFVKSLFGLLSPLQGTVPASIATGSSPQYPTISPDGLNIYTANNGGNSVSMFSINTSTGLLAALTPATLSIATTNPNSFCISPDGKDVYICNPGLSVLESFSRHP